MNYCSTPTSPVRVSLNAGCKLFAYAASHLLAHVKPSRNDEACACGTPHESSADKMCTSFSSAVVFWRKLMGYPSYASNCACVLPSFSPFYYIVARIVPAVQLAAHVKSSTLYGRPYGHKSNFFRLDGLLLFRIIMELHYAYCGLPYY